MDLLGGTDAPPWRINPQDDRFDPFILKIDLELLNDPGGLGDHPLNFYNSDLISKSKPPGFCSLITPNKEEEGKKENEKCCNYTQPD